MESCPSFDDANHETLTVLTMHLESYGQNLVHGEGEGTSLSNLK